MNWSRFLVGTLAVLLLVSSTRAAGVVYVDDDGDPAGDGSSWASPLVHLQDALTIAANPANGVIKIRVAQGTYLPDRSSRTPRGSGDRSSSFELVPGVALLGGYAGVGGPNPNERDVARFQSMLSGDLADDDEAGPAAMVDNSHHVLTFATSTEDLTILEGFTITGGNANGITPDDRGGGLYVTGSGLTVRHCAVVNNRASIPEDPGAAGGVRFDAGSGGGIFIDAAAITVAHCDFVNNLSHTVPLTNPAAGGGGVFNDGGDLTMNDCHFSQNFANDGAGGGLCGTSAALSNCTFIENDAVGSWGGAGVYIEFGATELVDCAFTANFGTALRTFLAVVSIDRCTFEGNTDYGIISENDSVVAVSSVFRGNGSGALLEIPASAITLTNCTVTENGSGMVGFATITNCIFWGNLDLEIDPTSFVNYTLVEGGFPDGYAVGNIDGDPLFVDLENGDLRLQPDSPCLDTGTNEATDLPDTDIAGDPRIQACRVDMGAFESLFFVDCDGNEVGDFCEIEEDPTRDCNDDEILDTCTIAEDPTLDCNRNRLLDSCDIESGTSTDDNQSGIPDECECTADVSGDQLIDVQDLIAVLLGWGPCPGEPDPCEGDVNGDGLVNVTDLEAVVLQWGPCSR